MQTRRFTDAVKAGKLEEAQELYAPTRQHYERIEPVAELFNDLDKSIDARADDFEKQEKDPAFVGFHRIEKALFADKSTAGMQPVADRLMDDVLDLQKRIATLTIPPNKMVGGAADLDRGSCRDQDQRRGGSLQRHRSVGLPGQCRWRAEDLRPAAPAHRQAKFRARRARRSRTLPRSTRCLPAIAPTTADSRTTRSSSPSDHNALKGAITALAEDLSQLRGTLGLD